MPTARVDDITLYYELHGSGEPLVLILGLGLDMSECESLIAELARHHQVLAFDNRGAGRSDKPDIPYSIELMADDTAGLMRATGVGIEQADILGISMGGRIALALALRHPELVKRLVLVSTAARSTGRHWLVRLLGLLSLLPMMRGKYPQPRYALVRQRRASSAYNCLDRLPEIQVPTLILHGERDTIVPRRFAEELRAGIRDSKLVLLPGGHLVSLGSAQGQLVDAVENFLGS